MRPAGFWLAAVAAGVIALVLNEIVDFGVWLTPKIIRSASARMPTSELRSRYLEEWQSELNFFDGMKLIKLGKAVAIWINSWRVAAILRNASGEVGLILYLGRLGRGFNIAAKAAWKAEIGGLDKFDIAHAIFAGWIVLVPTGGVIDFKTSDFEATPEGGYRFKLALTASAEVTRSVSWIVKQSAFLALACFDLYMIRRHMPFKDTVAHHRKAWRDFRNIRDNSS